MTASRHETLSTAFRRRFAINRAGTIPARVARLPVAHFLVMQRLGVQRWVHAPLFSGDRMWLRTGETISSGVLSFGYAEAALTALMLATLRSGMRFVDVGAHLGYEAVVAAALVGESGRVVSFEPDLRISEYATRSLAAFPQARVVPCALGERTGTIEFDEMNLARSAFGGTGVGASGARRINVPVAELDDALRTDERPVDVVKIDVEGSEMAVLRGASDVLRRDRPLLVLEAGMPTDAGSRERVDEFRAFLEPQGYRGVSFEFDGQLKVAPLGELVAGHANVAFVAGERMLFQDLEHDAGRVSAASA